MPSILLVAIFAYFPAASAIYHSFYRWNGDDINNYIGFANYQKALGTPSLWIGLLAIFIIYMQLCQKKGPGTTFSRILASIITPAISMVAILKLNPAFYTASENMGQALLSPAIGLGIPFLLIWFFVDADSENKILNLICFWHHARRFYPNRHRC